MLQREGYIEFNEDVNNPSKVHFLVGRDDLYKFQVANAAFDGFIKLLLRSYAGLFTDYVAIEEQVLAKRSKTGVDVIRQFLNKLSSLKIINYIPRKNTPLITYTEERLDDKTLYISPQDYRLRKNNFVIRIQDVIRYTFSSDRCRSRILLAYFGQHDAQNCGICDVCIKKNELGLSFYEFEQIKKTVIEKLSESPMQVHKLIEVLNFNEEKAIKIIRWLLDNNYLYYLDDQTIGLKN
jgi:ATP-dependent DNA helicase RecQ